MPRLRSWTAWFAATLALLLCTQVAAAQTFPKLTGRVVDDAHILSADQVQQLSQLSQSVQDASTRQLVVATIPDLQGYPIEDYGYKLGRAWGIGQKGTNNGVILLVAPKDRRVRIEVGYGLEPIMTDALSSMIVNQTILPHFRDGDMGGGVVAGAQAIAEQLKLPMDAAEQRAKAQVQTAQAHRDTGPDLATMIFWGVVILFVVVPMVTNRLRGGRRYRGGIAPVMLWGPGGGWGGGGGGGGGFGGGGFGGGGGFSGGGGGFGGGGASGGW